MGEPSLNPELEVGHGGSIVAQSVDDDLVSDELFGRGEVGERKYQINRLETNGSTTTRDYTVTVDNVEGSDAAMVTVNWVRADDIVDFEPAELPVGGDAVFGDLRLLHTSLDTIEISYF